ncbi:MAG: helix-hairpin-helix domain-containing protein, partial [Bacteroidales bacterium]|nr:helix-hairpin-helix domain-containing protein [Candidatus Sodaliphilus fimicaballi]
MSKLSDIISKELNIPASQVDNTVKLLDDGCTVPFISRYRKEATGGLDDVSVQSIDMRLNYYKELEKRRATILKTIEAQDKLTPELANRINNCWDATTLEDIYLPYKPKRQTRAEVARKRGLEPLARIIMAQHGDNIEQRAAKFINDEVKTADDAILGAQDIIAEWVSENEAVRNAVRRSFRYDAVLTSHFVKGKEIEGRNYENYYEFSQPLKRVSSHQLLAIRRGEKEGYLKVGIGINDDRAMDNISRIVVKGRNEASQLVDEVAEDSFKRLIKPSIETEYAAAAKAKADEQAIDTFAMNVRQLLFAPPLGHKRVLAVDPGFRTGCKVVALDEQGNLLHHDVMYPTAPAHDVEGATALILDLVNKYNINDIALGNGTASRETERFLKRINYGGRKVNVHVVSENGASIYSASKIARDEFPDKDVTVRGAVSIGRRLIDPLAELVKIDPKSIGVGQYQHDVDQNRLKEALNYTVESCVNSVGVNINTASKELLTYVAGLGPAIAQNIVNYRAANGDFKTRRDILNVPKLGAKTFTQAAGFLR